MTPSADDSNAANTSMDGVLEGILETLGKNPELMELAGKLAGFPEVSSAPEPSSKQETLASDNGNTLPKLMELLTGQNAPPEKASAPEKPDGSARATALLKALRPYMNEQRGDSVDRILRVLPTAKAIRVALQTFGRIQ